MKKLLCLTLFSVLFINLSHGQELLNLGYNYGTIPTNINEEDIMTAYTTWKNTFTESCGDDRTRVKFDTPTQTVSEGIGYGMLIAAYIGDQDLLDSLWNYYTDFLNINGLMNWKIEGCSSVIGFNAATDAELDVAIALIIASKRWGNDGDIKYEDDAKSLIEIIKDHEIEANTYVLKPGDMFGGSNLTNISYFAPGYYSAYKDITEDTTWDNVTAKSYDIINANLAQTGAVYNLVSDWCKADGNFSADASGYNFEGKKYSYDACRTPWRVALDYLWTGSTDALDYANLCIGFINNKNGLENIYPGYNLDGTHFIDSYKDVTFTGAYAIAAMASSDQEFVNNAYSKVVEMTTEAYFGSTLRVLYLLTLSGNFYSPDQFTGSLSINEQNLENNTLPYPNPVENSIHVSFSKSEENMVKIYNLNGQLILSDVYQEDKAIINTTTLSSGIYLLEVNDKRHKIIKK